MARAPLPMGTHGSISVKQREGGTSYVARCRFRDFDGVTRHLEYAGRSKGHERAPAWPWGMRARHGPRVAPSWPTAAGSWARSRLSEG